MLMMNFMMKKLNILRVILEKIIIEKFINSNDTVFVKMI